MRWFAYWIIWWLVRSSIRILFGFKVIGSENIPKKGPFILAVNHQSYVDPPMAAVAVPRIMHFFAKDELFHRFFLGPLITLLNAIPVHRGTYDPQAINRSLDILTNGGALIFFPEGTRGNGQEFLKPKPGIGLIAKRARVPVVPAFLYRTNRLLRAFFARKRVKIFFGPAISAEKIEKFSNDKDGYRSLAEYVMEQIGQLRKPVLAG
jgi:1-acyl-sn-glycerol-3-phosphate acyltransferase